MVGTTLMINSPHLLNKKIKRLAFIWQKCDLTICIDAVKDRHFHTWRCPWHIVEVGEHVAGLQTLEAVVPGPGSLGLLVPVLQGQHGLALQPRAAAQPPQPLEKWHVARFARCQAEEKRDISLQTENIPIIISHFLWTSSSLLPLLPRVRRRLPGGHIWKKFQFG